jgi:hypothetical protein
LQHYQTRVPAEPGELVKAVIELRGRAHKHSSPLHARLPTTLAELQSGFEIWLRFAVELGAITEAERNRLQRRGGGEDT